MVEKGRIIGKTIGRSGVKEEIITSTDTIDSNGRWRLGIGRRKNRNYSWKLTKSSRISLGKNE